MPTRLQYFFYIIFLSLLLPINAFSQTNLPIETVFAIQHSLDVRVEPDSHFIEVKDQITLPAMHSQELRFSLHSGLIPQSQTDKVTIKVIPSTETMAMTEHNYTTLYQVNLPEGLSAFRLSYKGKIDDRLESDEKEQSRGFRNTSGIIATEGVYLAGSSNWYPQFTEQIGVTFDLRVQLPDEWTAISQGKRIEHKLKGSTVQWQESHLQEEIYLIAAKFKEYRAVTQGITTQVFLRTPDESLANQYLDATTLYLEMYQKLIGQYPYSKFALVENFWETGFGMPSFTLLGSKVIRLPFIINSSYPHEILHNWWGNSVYIDYQSGNWSEGLTSYLADHLIKEQNGRGVAYRQQSLQKYADYAASERDFPLSEFHGRHSAATEAVGYGKALMFFHMLRQELGDDVFTQGLQAVYNQYQFQTASYDDWRKTLEKLSGTSLKQTFEQWIKRTGAPTLTLDKTLVSIDENNYRLNFELKQTQSGPVYKLLVPIAIALNKKKQAHQTQVLMTQKTQQFQIILSGEPVRLDIDPEFDLFRKLAIEETPPAFTRVFGSKEMLVVLPRNSAVESYKAYEQFAQSMSKMGPDKISIQWDDELDTLPDNMNITLLGWENKYRGAFQKMLSDYDVSFKDKTVMLNGQFLSQANNSVAFTIRQKNKQKTALSFIASDVVSALPGLARKLPHYHKYSYLAFSGTEPVNHTKGRWPVKFSPMTRSLLDNTFAAQAELKKRLPLVEKSSQFSADRMLESVQFLASEDRKGRGFGSKELEESADYIAQAFKAAGLKPGGDNHSWFESWQEKGGEKQAASTLKNVVAVIPGVNPYYDGQSVVIGAHYDHLGFGWPDVRGNNKGRIHPGADDNASGVAVLLELARVYGKSLKPERSIIFVAFSGEESGRKGSKYYLRNQKAYPASQIMAMLNLDTVGRLNNKQLLIIGAGSATQWPHIFRGIGFVTGIQTTLVKEALDSSDQVSFHEAGIPAVQLFSGINLDYHRPSDTSDKIDTKGLIKVAQVSKEIMTYLASREEPMNITLHKSGNYVAQKKQRKVSLGTIPDFTWSGEGYKLEGVVPESPAAQAGLKKGDVIRQLGEQTIHNIRDISRVLKTLKAGQIISIQYLRNDSISTVTATLKAK